MELDHIFILTEAGAPAAGALAALGLVEGSGNRHPGQGTACRRFFFRNFMLELLWVDDPEAVDSAPIRPSRLGARWRGRTRTCPFGICYRAGAGLPAAFPAFAYLPPWLPAGWQVAMADTPLEEPLWFQIDFGGRPDQRPASRREPLDHPAGPAELTAASWTRPSRPLSAASAAAAAGHLKLRTGTHHALALEFDHGRAGRQADLRPHLPLLLRW